MGSDRIRFLLGALLVLAVSILTLAGRADERLSFQREFANSATPLPSPTPSSGRAMATPVPVTPTPAPLDERCARGADGAQSPLAGHTVILDPGHGGDDLGTVNLEFGLFESEITLSIAERLRDRLVASGATVCLTRLVDVNVPLEERARFANQQDGDVFVSIHLNRYEDPRVDHTMTMWGEEEKDLRLAEVLLETLAAELSTPESYAGAPNPISQETARHERLDSILLRLPEMPAVLVEAVFLSHPWEARAFADGQEDSTRWREEQIARAIEAGLRQYFAESVAGDEDREE